jgi:hypothetical protein
MTTLLEDIRYANRTLTKARAFVVIAILTLAHSGGSV